MADAGSQISPARLTRVTCPRCHTIGGFVPLLALTYRCTRCEWPFTLGAPAVATPAVPASTVTAANTTGTVVAVTITGGTLTAVTVSGTQAGTTAGLYLVPAGGTIAVTYTVAPTWAWALPVTSASVTAGGTALTFNPSGSNVAFARDQLLLIDPAGTPDLVSVAVTGTLSASSVPTGSLNSPHNSGVSVAVAALTPAQNSEAVPRTSY